MLFEFTFKPKNLEPTEIPLVPLSGSVTSPVDSGNVVLVLTVVVKISFLAAKLFNSGE